MLAPTKAASIRDFSRKEDAMKHRIGRHAPWLVMAMATLLWTGCRQPLGQPCQVDNDCEGDAVCDTQTGVRGTCVDKLERTSEGDDDESQGDAGAAGTDQGSAADLDAGDDSAADTSSSAGDSSADVSDNADVVMGDEDAGSAISTDDLDAGVGA